MSETQSKNALLLNLSDTEMWKITTTYFWNTLLFPISCSIDPLSSLRLNGFTLTYVWHCCIHALKYNVEQFEGWHACRLIQSITEFEQSDSSSRFVQAKQVSLLHHWGNTANKCSSYKWGFIIDHHNSTKCQSWYGWMGKGQIVLFFYKSSCNMNNKTGWFCQGFVTEQCFLLAWAADVENLILAVGLPTQ